MSPDMLRLGSGDATSRPRVKVVGVGGAGCNIVSDSGLEAVAVCKPEESMAIDRIQKKCVLTRDHVKMLKTTSPQMFTAIGGTLKSGLFGAIGEADLMFLFTGLGGETGSSVTPALANIARKHCRLVIVSAALPFSVEGGERRYLASSSMEKVMEHSDMVISYQNDSLLRIAPNLPLRKAFTAMDMIMMAPVVELAASLTTQDLIQVRSDFAPCKHVRCGIGIGGGLDRELRAIEEAFTSPWFDLDMKLVKVALVVVSSEDVDPVMLEKIARDVAFRVPNAKVRYTSRTDPDLKGKVKTVVLLGIGPIMP